MTQKEGKCRVLQKTQKKAKDSEKKNKRLRKRAKDSEKRTKDSDKGEIEGETEDSEKAHKRLRKRGQHQKHRSALRALKNAENANSMNLLLYFFCPELKHNGLTMTFVFNLGQSFGCIY